MVVADIQLVLECDGIYINIYKYSYIIHHKFIHSYIHSYIHTSIVQAVNAWRLKQRFTGNTKEPFLPFLRELVCTILTKFGTKKETAKQTMPLPDAIGNKFRYPNYLPIYTYKHIYTMHLQV